MIASAAQAKSSSTCCKILRQSNIASGPSHTISHEITIVVQLLGAKTPFVECHPYPHTLLMVMEVAH